MPKMSTMFVLTLVLCLLAVSAPDVVSAQAAKSRAPAAAKKTSLDLGLQQFKQGNYEEAFDALTLAREQDPRSATAAYYLGLTLKKMQRLDQAISELLASVTLQPPVKEGFLELADAYYVMDKFDEALRALNIAAQERLDQGQIEFLRALVYMKKKDYPAAKAGFEKAKAADQKLASAADFQIATISQRLGKLLEARDLFIKVSDRDPGSDSGIMAKQLADTLTKQLDKKYSFNASVNAQIQYDSNVNLGNDVTSSGTGSISGEKDTSVVLALRAEYARTSTTPRSLKFQYNGYINKHQKMNEYDVQSHSVSVVPGYWLGENSASMPVTFTYTLVDSKKYLQAIGLTPTYSFTAGQDRFAVATIRYQKKNYLETITTPDENRDSTDLGAGISWSRLIKQQKGFLNFKYDLNKEDAVGENWSYLGHKIGAGALYPLTDIAKVSLGIEVYRQAFTNVNTSFGIKRTDTSYMGSAQLIYALTKSMDAQAQFVTMKADSTIGIYEYQKNIISIGLTARF